MFYLQHPTGKASPLNGPETHHDHYPSPDGDAVSPTRCVVSLRSPCPHGFRVVPQHDIVYRNVVEACDPITRLHESESIIPGPHMWRPLVTGHIPRQTKTKDGSVRETLEAVVRRPFDAVADAELSTACSYRDTRFMVRIYSDEMDSLVVHGLEQIDGIPSPYLRRAGAGTQQAADGLLLRCFNGGAVIARQAGLWMYRGSEGQSAGGEHGVVLEFGGCKASRGIVADRHLRLTLYVPWNAPVYVWPLPSDVAAGLLRDAVFG